MKFPLVAEHLVAATGFEPDLVAGRAAEQLIEERMRRLGLTDERRYVARLRDDAEELERVAEGIAVPETSLFRYPASFELLATWLRRRLARADDATVLRMVSVGCATGEEACSMAVAAVHAGWPEARIEIEGIDRSGRALQRAGGGRYEARASRQTPEWARSWLSTEEGGLRVRPSLLGRIRYRQADVLTLPRPGAPGYDVIFCRNVMIYLGGAARGRLVSWIVDALVPDGLLFVGHAEHAPALANAAFRPVAAPRSFAFSRVPETETPPQERRSPAVPAVTPTRRARIGAGKGGASGSRPRAARPAPRGPQRPLPVVPVAPAGLDEARALADRGALDEARVMIDAVIARDGPTATALELLGSVHVAAGDLRRAHDSFFRAVYLDPDHEEALLQLALICEQLGDGAQAGRYRARARRAHRKETAR